MDAASIEAEVARKPAPPIEVVEIDEDDEGRAAALFLVLDTQWNWTSTGVVQGNGGFGVRTGLKYEVIAPTALALGVTVDRRVMLDLRELEAAALKAFSEQRI
jgi:hypothetical protein